MVKQGFQRVTRENSDWAGILYGQIPPTTIGQGTFSATSDRTQPKGMVKLWQLMIRASMADVRWADIAGAHGDQH